MAHTPVQRDQHTLCGARKKTGDQCRAFAGQGTDHPGIGKCKFHGGSTPTHQRHAVVQESQRQMVKLGLPIAVDPTEALLQMLYHAAGHVSWLREEIASSEDLSKFETRVLVEIYADERDRVAKVAKAALDAGVAERHVKLAEKYGDLLANLLRAIFSDPELGLTEKQQKAIWDTVLRRHLLFAEEGRYSGQRELVA